MRNILNNEEYSATAHHAILQGQFNDRTLYGTVLTGAAVGHAGPVPTERLVLGVAHGGTGLTRVAPANADSLHTADGTATCRLGHLSTRRVEALVAAQTHVAHADTRL